MSHAPSLLIFLAASVTLALIPGPAVIFLMTQTLTHGRRAGLASVVGVAVGNLANGAVAACGLALVLAASSVAFTAIRLAGAAYLVYLGVRMLMRRNPGSTGVPAAPAPAAKHVFRDAALVALLNPKTALFFAALLPQFIDPREPRPVVASLLLVLVFVGIALCTDTVYVLTAASLRSIVSRRRTLAGLGRYLSACTFLALGIYAAVSGQRPNR